MSKKRKKIKPNKRKGSVHDRLMDKVYQRLEDSGIFAILEKNLEYREGSKVIGEVDVLAYDASTNTWYFYEVKSNVSVEMVKKAKKQYERYCKAHKDRTVLGFFVSQDNLEFRLK